MTAAAAAEPAIPLYALEGVERRYERGGSTVHALVGIDLTIAPGELLAIEGPSGSGKSTLLQLLGALDTPTGGRIEFDGQQLAQADDKTLTRLRRDAIGFVFQQFNLIPTLTAAENVEIAMLPLKRAARRADSTSGRRRCSSRSAWRTGASTCRRGCPAASSSGSPSPARWPTSRVSSSPTSRPATSTRRLRGT